MNRMLKNKQNSITIKSKPIAVQNKLANETISKKDCLIQLLILVLYISFKMNTFQNIIYLKTIELAVFYTDIFLNEKKISRKKIYLLALVLSIKLRKLINLILILVQLKSNQKINKNI
ncbi:unnamed protein product [Paramecium pentaurelia]|uniref:Transmembrane protein n=1 Tax=Paramecium pentaurelia TaxID=43138 RepID=A0A8S1SMP4_9CILI|nr:unnamed protein product [Paramecium pentaurelia]